MLKTIQHSKSSALYDEGKIHILKRNKGGYWRTTISFATWKVVDSPCFFYHTFR